MADQENILLHLDDVFRHLESGLNGMSKSSMHLFKLKSFNALKQVHFPDKKHEDWRYTSVQKLITPKYKIASNQPAYRVSDIHGLNSYIIPVINGKIDLTKIDPRLTELGLRFLPWPEALENNTWQQTFGDLVSTAEPSTNRAFELLNYTFNSSGFFLDIPKNTML